VVQQPRTPGISDRVFFGVNSWGLPMTPAISILVAATREKAVVVLATRWFSFLMPINGLFPGVATVVRARYSPSVVTGLLLYVPYFGIFFRFRRSSDQASRSVPR
jgi:hypothetical protein